MEEQKQIIGNIVDNSIEDIFKKVVEQFKLESGDFSPEETERLEEITDNLKTLLNEYVEWNK